MRENVTHDGKSLSISFVQICVRIFGVSFVSFLTATVDKTVVTSVSDEDVSNVDS